MQAEAALVKLEPASHQDFQPTVNKAASLLEVAVNRRTGAAHVDRVDLVAVEEPLEIRLTHGVEGARQQQALSITMRTPGDDFELAAGFLLTEGIIRQGADIQAIEHCGAPSPDKQLRNTVRVDLRPEVPIDWARLERHFYTSSSCGVCGKTSLQALETQGQYEPGPAVPSWSAETLYALPERLQLRQSAFDKTGGIHAAGLFDTKGTLLELREDVGRHNALDKLIGSALLAGRLPLTSHAILVSGRASFELLQKAMMAGCPLLAAVGAPSSLAIELAERFGMTLVGFLSDKRCNVYTGAERLC